MYSVAAGSFHRTWNPDREIAVTLAVTSTGVEGSSFVAGVGVPDIARFPRRPVENLEELVNSARSAYELESAEEDRWASFAFIENDTGAIAMALTKRNPDYWMPIGGRAKIGDESPEATVRRELFEEIGVSGAAIELDPIGRHVRDIGYGYTYFWSATVDDKKVSPNMEEFAEFRWLTKNEVLNLNIFEGCRSALMDHYGE